MTGDRIKLCAIAAAVAASLTGEVFGQSAGSAPGVASPAPAATQMQPLTPSTPSAQQPANSGRPRSDATAPQTSGPASTQPPSSRGLATGTQPQDKATTNNAATGAGYTGGGISGGVPTMGGVTPSRSELPGSAFTKLDAASRGYVTLEDVRQLDGFESAFRQADQNGDGRLNASEFNSAWGTYTGNVR